MGITGTNEDKYSGQECQIQLRDYPFGWKSQRLLRWKTTA